MFIAEYRPFGVFAAQFCNNETEASYMVQENYVVCLFLLLTR